MASVTLHCHPAALYYFLSDHVIDKNVMGLHVGGIPVNDWHDVSVAAYLMHMVRGTINENDPHAFMRDITLESEDAELLCWIAVAGPNRDTPPRDD